MSGGYVTCNIDADDMGGTAKLAISIARKLNALIFLVPEGESS